MTRPLGARELREILDRHGVTPSRALGQNFLIDPNTAERIVAVADPGPSDRVVEVGPGAGSMTVALAATGAEVVAVELDRHLLPVLDYVLADTGVRVVHGDATTLDWDATLGAGSSGWIVVANLPYNVGTGLILDLLLDVPQVERLVVMVQREVADRLVARPGSRTYGIPSVKVAAVAHGSMAFAVPPTVFFPRPRVASAVVVLTRRVDPLSAGECAAVFPLVERAFRQRRKMLRRSLPEINESEFARAGVDPTARPETIDLETWRRLAAVRSSGTP